MKPWWMSILNRMKSISGYICKILLLAVAIPAVHGQDTLRTYGPRFGIDVARFVYYFADPAEIGAEASVDLEVYPNIYPVVELGYNSINTEEESFDYASSGPYLRIGADYNLLPVNDRSIHHSTTIGFRYGLSTFSHQAENVLVPSDYWGDLVIDSYENSLTGHWIELVGGLKTELVPNFFLGWNIRYRILLNPEMDPLVTPDLVPGFGNGATNRVFGITYSILYKLPLLKR